LNHRVYNDAPRRLRWRSSLITTKYPELVLGPRGMPMVVRKIGAQLHLGVHNAQVVYFFFLVVYDRDKYRRIKINTNQLRICL